MHHSEVVLKPAYFLIRRTGLTGKCISVSNVECNKTGPQRRILNLFCNKTGPQRRILNPTCEFILQQNWPSDKNIEPHQCIYCIARTLSLYVMLHQLSQHFACFIQIYRVDKKSVLKSFNFKVQSA